jgi:hypothetical protein
MCCSAPRPSLLPGAVSVRLPGHTLVAGYHLTRSADYKFDLMYSKRAFVHWYVGEGMEEVQRIHRRSIRNLTVAAG